jgi:hypothetical protein
MEGKRAVRLLARASVLSSERSVRYLDLHNRPAICRWAQCKPLLVAVQLLEPRDRVLNSDAARD